MQDFLTFQTFITPDLLIVFYYIGALLIPVLAYYLTLWIKNKYFSSISKQANDSFQTYTSTKQRLFIYVSIFLCFLCIELIWRIMFEFFIAYFDMHDALIKLEGKE